MAASTSYTTPKYNLAPNDVQSVQRLVQSITSNIQKIAQNVSQIENLNLQIGTLKDSEQLRDKLLQTENYTNQLAKDTNKQLKELNGFVRNAGTASSFSSEDKQFKIQKERLTNELFKTLNKFQEAQKATMQKQKESNERAKANMAFNLQSNEEMFRLQAINSSQNKPLGYDADDDDTFGVGARSAGNQFDAQRQAAQISMESDVNLSQLKEREAALRKLENDIVDVNMIFKDLAVMVHDQGEMIDSIESNVEQVQIRVNEGNAHLESAKKSQQKARKKKFILIVILAAVVGVILLLVILSLHPWN